MSDIDEQQVEQNLRAEIRQIVDDRINKGVSIRPEWIAREIIGRRAPLTGKDAEFHIACAQQNISDLIKIEYPGLLPDKEVGEGLTADDYRNQAAAMLKHAQELEDYCD